MKKKLLVVGILISLLVVGCSPKGPVDQPKEVEEVKEADKLAEKTENWFSQYRGLNIDGEEIDASIFKGSKLNMVNVWASWCPPCIIEIPFLGQIDKAYDNKEFKVYGLPVESEGFEKLIGLSDEEKEMVQAILEESGAEYQQILVSGELLDTDFAKLSSYPTTFFLDSEGNFVGKPVLGANSEEDWKYIIEERLKLVEDK